MPEFITLTAMFAFGTTFFYVFWAVIVLVALIEAALVESERWGFAFFVTAAAVAVMGAQLRAVEAVKENPWLLGKFLAYYVTMGIAWMFAKWVVLIKKRRNRAQDMVLSYKNGKKIDRPLTDAEMKSVFEFDMKLAKAPLAKDNKAKLVNWAYLWPFSFIGTICGDWLRQLFVWLYEGLGRVLNRVSKIFWGGELEA